MGEEGNLCSKICRGSEICVVLERRLSKAGNGSSNAFQASLVLDFIK